MKYCLILKDYYYSEAYKTEYDTVELFESPEDLKVRVEYFIAEQVAFKAFAITPLAVQTKTEILYMDSGQNVC